jgi:hypothetical protein
MDFLSIDLPLLSFRIAESYRKSNTRPSIGFKSDLGLVNLHPGELNLLA